jgi:hypothetical protein
MNTAANDPSASLLPQAFSLLPQAFYLLECVAPENYLFTHSCLGKSAKGLPRGKGGTESYDWVQ